MTASGGRRYTACGASSQAGQARIDTGLETATAEACFQQALDMARQQGAKALELRATMSLSRLWLAQDQPDAAQTLLVESYSWFTEGWKTMDLQAAKDLLERCHNALTGSSADGLRGGKAC